MERDTKNDHIEIDLLKSQIEGMKLEEKSLGEMKTVLNSQQQKFEKFKEEKKQAEVLLQEKLQFTKTKIQESSYEKDRLEKEFYSLNYSLKNSKIANEEANELLIERNEEMNRQVRLVFDTDTSSKQKESELSKLRKDFEIVSVERKDLKSSFGRFEEELKTQLKLDKDLEDEELKLDLNESKINNELAILEKELKECAARDQNLLQRLKSDEQERERLLAIRREMEKEIIENTDFNEKLRTQKEDSTFKLKQESQRNLKLDGTLKQYQSVFTATEESLQGLKDKLGQIEERIDQRSSERSYGLTMLEEDKNELERVISQGESKSEHLRQIYNLHNDLKSRLESHSRNNKFAEFKGELLKILE
jgi:hypothetical protein